MILAHPEHPTHPLRHAITDAYRLDETIAIEKLLPQATLSTDALQRISQTACKLVEGIRQHRSKQGGVDAFLHEYDLSSEEGIALMCLAEALLRIPDTTTIDRLISDKISTAEWTEHLKKSDSLFVNSATWSLMLTGKIYAPTLDHTQSLGSSLKRLLTRLSGSVIRPIVLQGMKIIGKQFVMGTTINEALENAKKQEAVGYRYSYDMLGEAARTAHDAAHYFKSYHDAIIAIGKASAHLDPINGPGISVKLSALHPRYELAKYHRLMDELAPRLLALVKLAKTHHIGLTVDAEEADRLDLSLDMIEAVFSHSDLEGYEGFGLAVQAYQKRAPFVIDWLMDLSRRHHRKMMIRLIKGAYWDTEIKISQTLGLEGYPVFTRKDSTDVSYIACAKKIIDAPDCFYPQFGTHNAYTAATILEMMGTRTDYEFQCLHGMGAPLYDQIVSQATACRIYAPVGTHKDLLGYLVRRLLENGANSSFINRIADHDASIEKLIANPVARIASLESKPHPHIPLPKNIYQPLRKNSPGIDLSNRKQLEELKLETDKASKDMFLAGPIIAGKIITHTTAHPVTSPSNTTKTIGHVHIATAEDVEEALAKSKLAFTKWSKENPEKRSTCLECAAELFEKNIPKLMTLLSLEGGKQIVDCLSEIRETIDFCYYYAARARLDSAPITLTGPTGEFNQLSLHPRGIMICISPWNFPLAIFCGQILAALVCGNTVIAKPAEQTPLIATLAIQILHQAGIPTDVVQLLPGSGEIVGSTLVKDPRISGVMFTGSTDTAHIIQQALANRKGPIIPLIAETGGQNAMIVDSSALPEQVVADVIASAFNSAGQRCSALRVLFLQKDIAPRVLEMLKGAMTEITIGDPSLLSTDIGPVIDADALNMLHQHVSRMKEEATLLYQTPLPSLPEGYFFAPCIFELEDLHLLQREIFGPILHVICYNIKDLDKILDSIMNTGYGLTLGIHSRIDATIKYIEERMPVGNVYVNRNMIGAVVGVQPFGGERLSGTGPKAGGPYYLPRLCVERAISINTTAAGGNATLVSLSEG